MKLRLTPEIRFLEDEALERGSRVSILIFNYHSQAFSKVESPLMIKHFVVHFCNFFSSLLLICPQNDAQNTSKFTHIHFCGFDFIFVCIIHVWFGDLITLCVLISGLMCFRITFCQKHATISSN